MFIPLAVIFVQLLEEMTEGEIMNYNFYLEYKNTSVTQKYSRADEVITAASVREAAKTFAKLNNVRLSGIEALINGGHRVYMIDRKNEYAYYVEEK
jgi:uncharacterized Fe-S cluster-containing radical SAM superfamily protein